jgi:Trypsin
MHVTFCDFSLLYSGKGESAMMKISPVRLVFAWTCLLLFGTENSDAANNLLRGQWEREEFPAASASPPTQRHLIIGGKIAIPNDYPYFAHLEGIACGGSLIAPDVVLTAGHVSLICSFLENMVRRV